MIAGVHTNNTVIMRSILQNNESIDNRSISVVSRLTRFLLLQTEENMFCNHLKYSRHITLTCFPTVENI